MSVNSYIADNSFEETVANAAILRLHTACLWAEVSSVSNQELTKGNESYCWIIAQGRL